MRLLGQVFPQYAVRGTRYADMEFMMRPLLIKAAMRSADIGHLADQIQRLEAGGIDGLHFDVMDGRFVPELCMGPSFIRGLRKYSKLPFEVHLLVEEPDACLDAYLEAGADCILLHVEASRDPRGALRRIRERGRQAGLAIKPDTPARLLQPHLGACDVVNVMTVSPGMPGVLNEAGVRTLAEVAGMTGRADVGALVQVDGAVSIETRTRFLEAGARAMVAGYPIFSHDDFGQGIAHMRHGQLKPVEEVR